MECQETGRSAIEDPQELFYRNTIECVLNHITGAEGGLASVYQRHE
jgi:hypothetical protein